VSKNGFNDYLTTELSLLHDWDVDDVSPNALDDAGSDTAVDLIPGAGMAYTQAGDVSYETDDAVGFDGTSTANAINTTTTWNYTAGAMIFVFKTSGNPANGEIVLGYGSTSTTELFFFRPKTSGQFEYRIIAAGTNDLQVKSGSFAGVDFFDGNYHFVIVNQPGDGNGVNFLVNGVEGGAHSTESYTGTKDEDSWFQDSPTDGRVTLGAAPDGANNNMTGAVSRMAMASAVVTPTQAAELQVLRSSLTLQDGANKRRRGRKYFKLGA
jgi:hypothetical protein